MPDKWRRIADQLALELEPHAYCDTHSLNEADPYNCPACANRRAYLNYLAAGGTDTRIEANLPSGTRSVPLQDLPMNPHMRLPDA